MRLSRRRLLILMVPAVLVLFAAAGFLLRLQIAEMVIRSQIAARGLDSEVHVAALGLHEAELRDVTISHLHVGRVRVRYAPLALRRGVIEGATVEGVTLTVDLTGKGPVLGDLQRLFESSGEQTWTRLPDLTLRQSRVLVLLQGEQLPIDLSADIVRGAGDAATLAVNAGGLSRDLQASGVVRAKFEGLVPVQGALTADIAHRRAPLKVALRANTESLRAERPDTKFSLTAEGPLLALTQELGSPERWRPQSGDFRLAAEGHVSMGVTPKPFDRPEGDGSLRLTVTDMTLAEPADWLSTADGTATAEVKFANQIIDGSANFDLAGGRGKLTAKLPALRVALNDDQTVRDLTLTGLAVTVSGLPTAYGRLGEVSLSGSLAGPPAAPQGGLRMTAASPALHIADFAADGVTLTTDIAVAAQEGGFRFTLNSPGRLRLQAVRMPALLPIRGIDAAISSGFLDFKPAEAGWQIEHKAVLALPPMALQAARKDAKPLPLNLRLRPVTYSVQMPPAAPARLELQTRIDSLVLPEAAMAVRNSDVALAGDPIGVIAATFSGGTLAQETKTPFFAPLTPQFRVTRKGAALDIDGTLQRVGVIDIAAKGSHDMTNGHGRLHLDLKPILFNGRGGDADRISPMLAGMDALRGRVQGQADLAWDAAGFDGKGVARVEDMSFTREGIEVEDVDTVLTLDHLIPLTSAAHQEVTIRRIGAGVDLTDVALRYALRARPDGAPRIANENLAFNVLGGRVTAEGGTIDPATADAMLTLKPERLDLTTLIGQLGFKELTGAGKISGTIPVLLEGGVAEIAGAEMHADGAGRIAFKSPDTRQALASGGDAVKLMLDALEDFRFETLRMTLDKPKKGDSKILVQLNGNNPAVLDGQVFNLNINLTGNAEPLLDALAESRRLQNQVLQPLFRLQ